MGNTKGTEKKGGNRFINSLIASNKEIKAARAKIVGEDALDASEELVRNLKAEKRELERKLLSLSDMNRDSELSLLVVKADFNAKNWIKEIHEIKVKLALKEEELKIAEETHNEWFSEEKEEEQS